MSAAVVNWGEVAEGLMVGIPAGPVTVSDTGNAAALALGPTMAGTPWVSTRRRAASTAMVGSLVASAAIPSTGWPSTPPPSLMCCIARLKARSLSAAVSGESAKLSNNPIFIEAEASGLSEVSPPHATTATSKTSECDQLESEASQSNYS